MESDSEFEYGDQVTPNHNPQTFARSSATLVWMYKQTVNLPQPFETYTYNSFANVAYNHWNQQVSLNALPCFCCLASVPCCPSQGHRSSDDDTPAERAQHNPSADIQRPQSRLHGINPATASAQMQTSNIEAPVYEPPPAGKHHAQSPAPSSTNIAKIIFDLDFAQNVQENKSTCGCGPATQKHARLAMPWPTLGHIPSHML